LFPVNSSLDTLAAGRERFTTSARHHRTLAEAERQRQNPQAAERLESAAAELESQAAALLQVAWLIQEQETPPRVSLNPGTPTYASATVPTLAAA
jgi:hypothetical protein